MNEESIKKRESVKNDYDIIAEQYAEEFGREYEDFEVISKFMNLLKENDSIVDLGGGTGKLTDLFMKNGFNATCYDFSKEMMRKSKEYFGDLPYILDDILNVKEYFKDETLNGVIAFYSLFHIPRENIQQVFADINSILKINGIFCFIVRLGEGEGFIDEPYLEEEGKGILYFNFFTQEEVDELLKQNNFEKIYETTKESIGENELGDKNNKKLLIIAKKIK